MADANGGNGRVTTREFYGELLKIAPQLQALKDAVEKIEQRQEEHSADMEWMKDALQQRAGARKLGTILWRAATTVLIVLSGAVAAFAAVVALG